jgi:uncharacterized protein YjbJ (UPF0337 family)
MATVLEALKFSNYWEVYMGDFKRKYDYSKNKFAGEIKETTGKVTGNKKLELKGKIQSSKADLKKNLNLKDKIEDIKEEIAGNINDRIDKNKKKQKA